MKKSLSESLLDVANGCSPALGALAVAFKEWAQEAKSMEDENKKLKEENQKLKEKVEWQKKEIKILNSFIPDSGS